MTPAQIERLARQAGVTLFGDDPEAGAWAFWLHELHQFAALVRAAALEEAAQLAEDEIDPEWPGDDLSRQAESLAGSIRALAQQAGGEQGGETP
jgi:HPt (histidine-containing phosphotransfer) domain-containing protein